jgi:hypothetical protein
VTAAPDTGVAPELAGVDPEAGVAAPDGLFAIAEMLAFAEEAPETVVFPVAGVA